MCTKKNFCEFVYDRAWAVIKCLEMKDGLNADLFQEDNAANPFRDEDITAISFMHFMCFGSTRNHKGAILRMVSIQEINHPLVKWLSMVVENAKDE
jgi:hypothetical protein